MSDAPFGRVWVPFFLACFFSLPLSEAFSGHSVPTKDQYFHQKECHPQSQQLQPSFINCLLTPFIPFPQCNFSLIIHPAAIYLYIDIYTHFNPHNTIKSSISKRKQYQEPTYQATLTIQYFLIWSFFFSFFFFFFGLFTYFYVQYILA